MYVHLDCRPDALHDIVEFELRQAIGGNVVVEREGLCCRWSHPVWRLKDRVMDLERLLVCGVLLLLNFEFLRDLVGPSLKPRIDGLDVDAGIGTLPPSGGILLVVWRTRA
jgi:hypothetical protein